MLNVTQRVPPNHGRRYRRRQAGYCQERHWRRRDAASLADRRPRSGP